MPQNWKTYRLGELIKLKKNSIRPDQFDGQAYLGLEHIGQGTFLLDGIGSSSDVSSNKYRFDSGDILYGKIRPYFKKAYQPNFDGICSTDILVIQSKKTDLVDQKWLYQLIKTQWFTDKAVETSSGTKMPRADWNSLKSVEISIPPLPEQKSIASILSALDDKIENNLAMNKTLEEMAMALYKHWFVDFGPFQEGEFVPSELGDIPKGWEVKKIVDFGSVVCGKTPSKKISENFVDKGGFPFIKIPDMHGKTFIVETIEQVSEKGHRTQIKKLIPANSVNVSCIATVGLVSINPFPSHTNQQINSVVPKKDSWVYYLYSSMIGLKERFLNEASGGSATLNMNTSTFSNVELLKPSDEVLCDFHGCVEPYFLQIQLNQIENQSLTQLRDTLLPKLISGEVRVKDAEQIVANAL